MTAKEMFEDLGYKEGLIIDCNNEIEVYSYFKEEIGCQISFNCLLHEMTVINLFDKKTDFYLDEIRAINEKLKELGWLEATEDDDWRDPDLDYDEETGWIHTYELVTDDDVILFGCPTLEDAIENAKNYPEAVKIIHDLSYDETLRWTKGLNEVVWEKGEISESNRN
ncbi:MAG: hypothetical protein IJI83_02990 [Oscillospiraceae bacterium]|nr:hypothetical protein [Oscillospiraceae bacterium]